ncbi:MAG: Allergen V5/Tpx-1 related [uncultured Blastococcus sp.]|uniref:Allergen V5/Tpx-1 related n=1 Tax=uncultured Blastococcus sp. TaxID=217144 RepID=A0A6J4IIB8_9ACTN|nr:MAG: Allergen V5/Tpx-1 related [uncultured Blastococcus sp.]
MHHASAGPPLLVRLISAFLRRVVRSGAGRRRGGRVALRLATSAVVTGLVLAIPVMGSSGSSATDANRDGRLLSAGELTGLTAPSAPEPTATGSLPGGTPRPVPVPPPAPVVPVVPVVPGAPAPEAPAPEPEAVEEIAVPEPAPTPAAAATPVSEGGTAGEVVSLVNAERAGAGCGPVAWDDGLAAVAQAHSDDMRDRDYFDHTNLDGLDPFDRAARAGVSARAENIAWGQVDAADVMSSWMDSAGHRANILNCGLTRLGVGIAQGAGGPWWTQLFG